MMSESETQPTKNRPFPWHCIECGRDEIFPCPTDYVSTEQYDGQSYPIHIADLEIPTCRNCGEQLITSKVDDRILAELRAQASILTPKEIQDTRCSLGLSRQTLATQLGVSEENVRDWETGYVIQSRALDDAMRFYFDVSLKTRDAVAAGA